MKGVNVTMNNALRFINVIAILMLFTGCRHTDVNVIDISLSHKSLELMVGESVQLEAMINPANATNKSIVWASSDAAVASVDQNGLVVAKQVGRAIISATAVDGGKSARCEVVVSKPQAQEGGLNATNINIPDYKNQIWQ